MFLVLQVKLLGTSIHMTDFDFYIYICFEFTCCVFVFAGMLVFFFLFN